MNQRNCSVLETAVHSCIQLQWYATRLRQCRRLARQTDCRNVECNTDKLRLRQLCVHQTDWQCQQHCDAVKRCNVWRHLNIEPQQSRHTSTCIWRPSIVWCWLTISWHSMSNFDWAFTGALLTELSWHLLRLLQCNALLSMLVKAATHRDFQIAVITDTW